VFLATTALSDLWDVQQDLLFLGSWCLRYDRRDEWSTLRYRVLPSPWDDRSRFYQAAQYVDACYERVLPRVAEHLNTVHHVAYSHRYWRIVIGPWLLHFVHSAYDRYVHLADALAFSPWQTMLMDPRSFRTPRHTHEALNFLNGDPYNAQVYSQLLSLLGYEFPARPVAPTAPWSSSEHGRIAPAPRVFERAAVRGMELLGQAARRLRGAGWRIAFHEMDTSRSLLWPLVRRSAFRALPLAIPQTSPPVDPTFDHRRTAFGELGGADEFERLLVRLLPQNLPTLFLEGYHAARSEALRERLTQPSVVASAIGWYFDEPFKFLAAEAADAGKRIVAVQHGGGYGVYRFAPLEQHEAQVSDALWAWGWAEDGSTTVHNVPSPVLSSLPARPVSSPPPSETILFVMTAHPRYLYRFHSSPVGSQWSEYFEWAHRFLDALPQRLRARVFLRAYRADYGHCVWQRMRDRWPGLRGSNIEPCARQLRRARVVVSDHCSTTLLESLRMNIPTVLFWDPNRWEVRQEAESDFEAIRSAGILWQTPEAAAKQLIDIYEDPSRWWERSDVQTARQRFVDRYALAQADWAEAWTRALDSECAMAGVPTRRALREMVHA